MTDEALAALAALAKAGDRRAMNALLTRHEPYIRRMVARALRQSKRSFEVGDDALQVGRMAFWRCVRTWDPSVAPLEVLAWSSIQRAVWEEAARMGGSTVVHYGRRGPRVVCFDAPIGDDPDAPPLVSFFEAQNPDAADIADANRLLGQLTPREVDVLCRVAADEPLPDIGADYGVTRQRVKQCYEKARVKAERIAGGMIRKAVA